MEPRPRRDARLGGRLGRGVLLSLLLHAQLLIPGLIATWIYAGREEERRAEEVGIDFIDADSEDLPADLPPLDPNEPRRDKRRPKDVDRVADRQTAQPTPA